LNRAASRRRIEVMQTRYDAAKLAAEDRALAQ
jgi:hypothetical protein